MEWPDLRALVDAGDVAGVVRVTGGLSEEQLRRLAGPVKKHASWLRREWSNPRSVLSSDVSRWQRCRNATAVACAACLPTAAALAPELTRDSLSCLDHAFDVHDACGLPTMVSAVLRARGVPWLPELVGRLAGRLPSGDVRRVGAARGVWRLTAELAAAAGMDVPLTDGFVAGWAAGFWFRPDEQVTGMMRGDPWLTVLVPRLFEVDGAAMPYQVLAALAADGTLDRQMLISGCLAGLRRNGNPGHSREFCALLEALGPGLAERAQDTERIRDYVALLPAAHRVAAELGQEELRRLDEAGRLEFGTLLEISEIVLRRREHKLVRAQLDWLDAAARRDPSRPGELVRAVAVAFGQQSRELQRRALTVAVRHASHAGDAALADLAEAATALRPDLRDRAAKAFGTAGAQTTSPAPATPKPVPVIAVPPVSEMPAPISSPAELASELAALYADCSNMRSDGVDPIAAERVLAAIVDFAHRDRADLGEVLRPVLTRYKITPGPRDWSQVARALAPPLPGRHRELPEGFADLTTTGTGSPMELTELGSITGAAVAAVRRTPGSSYPSARQVKGEWFWRTVVAAARLEGPRQAFIRRLHEIAVGLTYAPRPLLVATPTTASGLLDPDELLARLERAAAEGWQPWPCDLEQALLRLPRNPGGNLAQRARQLGTPAGSQLARWLDTDGLPDPEVTIVRRTWDNPDRRTGAEGKSDHFLATIRPPRGRLAVRAARAVRAAADARVGVITALLTTLDRPERLMHGNYGQTCEYFNTAWLPCWPSMLPAHRDVIAAHLIPHFARHTMPQYAVFTRYEPACRQMLPLLAEAAGPARAGMNLALCYGLTAHGLSDRAAAVDALLTLAGRGQLNGTALGTEFGTLAATGDVQLNRAVPALADAARAGAHTQVWALVAAALPRLLPPTTPHPPPRLADLIALGTETAEIIRPHTTIPGLAEVAGRGGSARFVTESRRLLKIVSANER
jgi:Family of unknown function (DUF6493)